MKAPDKLYCMHRLNGDYSCSTTPFGGSYEYIRKDIIYNMLTKEQIEVLEKITRLSNFGSDAKRWE